MRVPVFLFNTLNVVTKNDKVGVYGTGDSEPVQIRFLFLAGFGFALLWIILLPLFLLKSNRKKAAWLILAVVILIHILLFLLQQWNPGGVIRQFNLIVHPLATGLGLVWLMNGMFKAGRNLQNGAVVVACMILTGLLGLACYYGWVFSWSVRASSSLYYGYPPSWSFMFVQMCISYGLIGLVLVLGARYASVLSKKPIRRIPYSLRLLACDVVLFFLGTAVLVVLIKVFRLWPDWLMKQFLPRCWKQMLLAGAAAGLVLFIVQLPFILLTRASSFFVERYKAIFGVEMDKPESKRK